MVKGKPIDIVQGEGYYLGTILLSLYLCPLKIQSFLQQLSLSSIKIPLRSQVVA